MWPELVAMSFFYFMIYFTCNAIENLFHPQKYEDIITIDLFNEEEWVEENLQFGANQELNHMNANEAFEDVETLPLYIRNFLDNITEPLPAYPVI